jgi:hypothetical protein
MEPLESSSSAHQWLEIQNRVRLPPLFHPVIFTHFYVASTPYAFCVMLFAKASLYLSQAVASDLFCSAFRPNRNPLPLFWHICCL